MTAPTVQQVTGRSLIEPELFDRLTTRLVREYGVAPLDAGQVMDQALAYLATCAQKPADAPSLHMSRRVDAGWHAFMEYTREYDNFFQRDGWHKVHHNPCDGWGGQTYPPAAEVLPVTVVAIEAAGYQVEHGLWAAPVDCGDTCGDDGGGGNPLPTCEHST